MIVRATGAGTPLGVAPFRICHDNSNLKFKFRVSLASRSSFLRWTHKTTFPDFGDISFALLTELIAKIPKGMPAGIGIAARAAAVALVQILPAAGAESFAIFSANQLQRDRQQ
jgi:hypothetical protein